MTTNTDAQPSCLTVAVDNSADELEICDRELQFMWPDDLKNGNAFVRYVCSRCETVGEAAFGPAHQINKIREQAEALFDTTTICEAMA